MSHSSISLCSAPPPFSLYLLTLLCCALPQFSSFQYSLQSSLGPRHLLFLWPSYPHDLHTSGCLQLSLLMHLALTQPGISYREVPPSHTGLQLPRDGDAHVSLLCSDALVYAHFVAFLYCVCKSSPTRSQGGGLCSFKQHRQEGQCLHHSNLHKRQR